MLVSTKGRYALRVMIDLTEHNTGEFIPLKDIVARQEISEKYLESIIVVLSKAGLVDGARGKGGGYRLNRPPEDYRIRTILELVDGPLVPVSCLSEGVQECPRAAQCKTLPMWTELGRCIGSYLDQVSLKALAEGQVPPLAGEKKA